MCQDKSNRGLPHVTRQVEVCLLYPDKSSGGLPHLTIQVKWGFASCTQTSQVEVCLM
ncbi:hypothetical protein DPMN_007338 [Dreissena polymorpha]|uniref:Uncharacterized protein n=1 Tax=Dreissena polymorpha TaxID=45954 RepID=A0A9D4MTH8_DREPO|nr:hypothetical protein DPMN_007311 [Dreissena polymorpha]KAH3883357.1 hypothetical protein DPMN_007312 [Dreissena polymorpha]KAH3883383.1 hypothetical protein DPMN_007338 [Dreissena polymorpha]